MAIGQLLEAGMMICWGCSWPVQVAKTYTTKDVSGKSIVFLWLIQTGYILGLLYKIFFNFDYVIWLYLLNFIFVGTDMILYYSYRNRKPVAIKKLPLINSTIKEKTEVYH
ncbi:MAG: PQ-loop domain-containing transporter [Candidatus Gastranaerophilales bacterium]|nr:PQ-loop domain-containing transporter [Candidatus Gastranaerophilales bacterium]